MCSCLSMAGSGSSPLVRGARSGPRLVCKPGRIIPARAGSTVWRVEALPNHSDHPRSCGEHPDAYAEFASLIGSSPLVRGAPGLDVCGRVRYGIIPARAGSTLRQRTWLLFRRDHPRSCGEHESLSSGFSFTEGSSPLVRGAPWKHTVQPMCRRIIPARAGSTMPRPSTCTEAWDHPRSCGEHHSFLDSAMRHLGSSPLVRGALHGVLEAGHDLGIIPARAGSTLKNLRNSSMTQSFLFNYQGTSWQSD